MNNNYNDEFWEQFDEIPVWNKANGILLCTDKRTGRVLKTSPCPILPDGSSIEFFKPYKVLLVNNVTIYNEDFPSSYLDDSCTVNVGSHCSTISSGTEVYVGMQPNGQFYLALSDKSTPTIGGRIELGDFSFLGKPKPASANKNKP